MFHLNGKCTLRHIGLYYEAVLITIIMIMSFPPVLYRSHVSTWCDLHSSLHTVMISDNLLLRCHKGVCLYGTEPSCQVLNIKHSFRPNYQLRVVKVCNARQCHHQRLVFVGLPVMVAILML